MTDNQKLDEIYNFLKTINKFKSVERLSVIKENGRRESDAEHTWHLVMFVWLYSTIYETQVDLLKCLKMALVHDLVEIYAGDVYGGATEEARAGKEEREKLAAQKLFGQLPEDLKKEFFDLWEEYESKKDPEAEYVWALDKIMPRFMLTITGKDFAEGMPTDHAKDKEQREKVTQISSTLGRVLAKISKERNLD